MRQRNSLSLLLRPSPVYVLIGLFFLIFSYNSVYGKFNHDEFEAVHSAWKIFNNEAIYVDFFQHHHPFFYYVLTPVFNLFDDSSSTQLLIFLRIAVLFIFSLLLLIVYKTSIALFDRRKIAVVSLLLLLSTTMFMKSIEIRPDIIQTLFGLVAVYFFVIQLKEDSTKNAILGAISLGISFLFLQKAIFLIAGIGFLYLLRVYFKKSSFKNYVIYWCVFLLSISPYFIYLFINNLFDTYIFWNWTINMEFLREFSILPKIKNSLVENYFVWIFFAIGLYNSRAYKQKEFSLLVVILLLSISTVKTPYEQYYMLFFPLMSIVSAQGFVMFFGNNYIAHALLYLAIIYSLNKYYLSSINAPNNIKQLDKIKYVVSNTTSNDFVYDGNIKFNVFRRDIDYFWYSVRPKNGALATYKFLYPYTYNVYNLINQYKPKIISNYYIDDMNHNAISKHYQVSNQYSDIYIRND